MGQTVKWILLMIMICSLAACHSKNEVGTYELLDVEEAKPTEVLQQRAKGAMVRLCTDSRNGSGVIFFVDQEKLVILTVAHLLEDVAAVGEDAAMENGRIRIELGDGTVLNEENYGDWKILLSAVSDFGWIEVPVGQVSKEALKNCRYVPTDKESFDGLSPGNVILIVGSADEVAADVHAGTVADPWIYMSDYGQHMMLGIGSARAGMSGGGVFDQRGRLIGILSGADERGYLAIVPLSHIVAELQP